MRRGTTPTLRLSTDADLTGCRVRVIIRNGGRSIVKSGDDVQVAWDGEASHIRVRLSQADTLSLQASHPAKVQVRFALGDDAQATDIATVRVDDILEEGEI